jgi:hypothetical protein
MSYKIIGRWTDLRFTLVAETDKNLLIALLKEARKAAN